MYKTVIEKINIKDLLFNKKFGRKYMIINIILTLFPVISSIRTNTFRWVVSLSLFFVYVFSYSMAYLSYEQNRKIGRQIDPDMVLKAFSFVFGMIAILIYTFIRLFIYIPFEIAYIFINAIISLFILYAKIFDEETKHIMDKKEKTRKIFNVIWTLLPKSFFLKLIFIILVIILVAFTICIYLYLIFKNFI